MTADHFRGRAVAVVELHPLTRVTQLRHQRSRMPECLDLVQVLYSARKVAGLPFSQLGFAEESRAPRLGPRWSLNPSRE